MNVCGWRKKVLSNRTYSFRGKTILSVFAIPHEPGDPVAGEEARLFATLDCAGFPGRRFSVGGYALIYRRFRQRPLTSA
jgi:hypothetical protein